MDSPADLKPVIRQSDPIDMSKGYDAATLRDKVVVITGAANGLGAAMARAWAAHGAHVFVGDVDDAAGEALVAELRAAHAPQTFHYQRCNVADWDDQVALFDTAARLSPCGIDVVVPNAGVLVPAESLRFESPRPGPNGALARPSTLALEVNVVGVAYTTHLALHHLALNPRPDRCLLLVGSVASLVPLPGQAQYTMSKHAVAGLFRALRGTAFARGGIRVNMLAPYYVAGSRMLPALAEAALLAGSAGPAAAADVVDAATRLVADESIAGRALVVGPRLGAAPEGEVRVGEAEGGGAGRAAWECYAGDYDDVEVFSHRYVRLLAAAARARGALAWVADWWSMLFSR